MKGNGTCDNGWYCITVDSSGDVNYFTSLALDSNNKVHISYYDYDNKRLKYATNALNGTCDNGWYCTTVDSNGDVGMTSSLALDSNNKVHISYWDVTNGDLKYAYTLGPSSPSISINSGAEYTNSKDVTLTLSAKDDPTEMLISENPNFSGASWETYATSKAFSLSSGDGTKTVYAKFRDKWYAETDAVSDTIVLDTTGPVTTATPKAGKYNSVQKITLSASDNPNGSGVDKIYYTIDGKTPTTSSSVYSTPIVLTKNTTLKYFAVDKMGNKEAVKTAEYTINKAKFVTKSPKTHEALIQKKNTQYSGNDLSFIFKSLPFKLTKSKYYLEFQKITKAPKNYPNFKKSSLGKYFVFKTNLNKYQAKKKKDQFKIELIFKYTDQELKALKKKNKALNEKNLALYYYSPKTKTWKILPAKLNTKKNTLDITFNKFLFSTSTTYFAIGVK